LFALVGEAGVAIIALYRVVELAAECSQDLRVSVERGLALAATELRAGVGDQLVLG
jgi:hypothetical protein